jgi:hypothetical protein
MRFERLDRGLRCCSRLRHFTLSLSDRYGCTREARLAAG